jgi:hypothetical protein
MRGTSKTAPLVWLSVIVVTLVLLAPRPAIAQGFIQLSSGPIYPPPGLGSLVIGQTAVPLQYQIVNTSNGPIVIDSINYVPACKTSVFTSCTGAMVENVFSNFSGGATDASSSGCIGMTFAFGTPVGGVITITPSSTITLAQSSSCIFDFTADVTGVPTFDADSGFPGFQAFGSGFSMAHGGINPLVTGSGTGSSEVTVDTCEIKLDKQISCDGGASWQDVTGLGATNEGTATDPADSLVQGCVARGANSLNPQQVKVRYVLSNALPTAAPVSCTSLTDSAVTGNISASFPIQPQAASTPVVINGSPFACTNPTSGNDTATLNTCTCTAINGVNLTNVSVPVDSGSLLTDTATHLCADVTVDKEISCNAGASFVDVGQTRNNSDGTISCNGTTGVKGIEAQWFAQNQGTVPLTCTLSDSNANLLATPTTSIGLANGVPTPTGIGGPTAAQECSAALKVGGVTKEPDTATLTCSPVVTTGIVDVTGGLSVFDQASFGCSAVTLGFNSSKTCTPTGAPNSFSVGVTVTNTDTSGASTLSCTVADQSFAGNSGICPPATPDGPAVTITPGTTSDPLAVGAFGSGTSTVTGMGTLTSATPLCNQATVTCIPTVGGVAMTALPIQTPTAECTPPSGGAIKIKKVFIGDTVTPSGTTTVTFTVINQGSTALTDVAFSDVFPPHLNATTGTGTTSQCFGGSFVVTTTTATLTGGSLAAGAQCSMSVNLTADGTQTTPVEVCDQTSPVTSDQVSSLPAFACITITTGSTPLGPPGAFQVGYAANLGAGDSYIDLSNSGALNGTSPNGDICVNIYTFDPSEEMISCCSCLVTPNALNSVSVLHDLLSSTLTNVSESAVVIKLLANAPDPGLCNPTSPTFQNLTPGLLAWGTTLHAGPGSTPFSLTERPFTTSTLSAGELSHLTQFCAFIQSDGSGSGQCTACQGANGALGAAAQR